MKKILLTLCCSLVLIFTVPAQWTQLTTGLTGELEAVHMHDVNTIIVGTAVGISTSTDAGTTWNNILLGEITSLSFVSSTTGYAAGDNGVVYKTADGGFTWNLLTTGTSTKLRALHFYNENIGAAAGESGVIIVTNNGGATWTSPSSGTSVRLMSVFFNTSTTGYIGGRDGVLRKTTDSGNTWTTVNAGLTEDISSIFFVDANTGFMAEEEILRKTTDGGNTWNPLTTGNANEINDIYFLSSNEGYAVGAFGTILKTLDGGATWNPENSPTINELESVHFYNPDNGFAVGNLGTVLKFYTATGVDERNTSEFKLFPNPSRDYFIIKSEKQGPVVVEITDIIGKSMAVINTQFNQNIRHGLKDSGFYIVKITAGNEKPVFKRLKVN
jgi:photosystem II stability/assembly factor-like uncharacterized protein